MHRFIIVSVFGVLLPVAAMAETAQIILENMRQRQQQRWAGVNTSSYVVDQTDLGRSVLFYERVNNQVGFRLVPPGEVQQRIETNMKLNPNAKAAISSGILQGAFIGEKFLASELPLPVFAKNLITNGVSAVGQFLLAANSSSAHGRETRQDVQRAAANFAEFEKVARLAGVESLDGKEAFLLVADNLDRTQITDDGKFTLNTVNMWVDTSDYVLLGLRMEGVMTSGKASRNVTILRRDYDHKETGSLYEPHRQTVAIRGILDEKQMKEIQKQIREFEKSKGQMQAFKARLANLPQAQQDMMMATMRSQMAMFENMERQIALLQGLAHNNEVAVETVVHEIRIGGLEAYVAMTAKAFGKSLD
ncbi:MAG: hypothetical protein JSU96_08540 [Acidobacteriota bacterium]|nr:MAG: hypothetical protein JSU96_08540 [Acidobacteriota bacterium]